MFFLLNDRYVLENFQKTKKFKNFFKNVAYFLFWRG